jgi:hypothetical protein
VDPPVAPAGVLLRQSEDEAYGAGGDRWPSGVSVRIGPASAHEFSVPAKQGVRLDEESVTPPAGEQSRETGEERPVGWLQCGPGHLAAQDRHLVSQDDDLDGEHFLVTVGKPDQLGDAKEEEVEEPKRHDAIFASAALATESPGHRVRMAFLARSVSRTSIPTWQQG